MDITCERCRRDYFVPDDLVHGRTFRAKCGYCGHAFVVDVAALSAGAAALAPVPVPGPSSSASALPELTEALSDADLGWLADAAGDILAPPPEAEPLPPGADPLAPPPWAPVDAPLDPSTLPKSTGFGAPLATPAPLAPALAPVALPARPAPAAAPPAGEAARVSPSAAGATAARPAAVAPAAPAAPRRGRAAAASAASPDAAAADAGELEEVLLTVRRTRRGNLLAFAGGAVALAVAVGALSIWASHRRLEAGPARARPAAAAEDGAAPILDVGGLAARSAPPDAPSRVPAAAPAPLVIRAKPVKGAKGDRKLLDLLGRKDDAAVVGVPDEAEPQSGGAPALDPAVIEKVMGANRGAFDACISKTLRLNPSLKLPRRATMVVTIQPAGTVTAARIEEEAVDRSDLGACLSQAARRMAFPSFDGDPLDVAMPLSLSAVF